MTNIEKALIEVENEIKQIKTTQLTQNDSYRFYKIHTDNLYVKNQLKYAKITFVPYRQDNLDEVICLYRLWGPTARVDQSLINTDIRRPLEAYFLLDTWGDASGVPKEVYICCLSNSDGFLQIEWL